MEVNKEEIIRLIGNEKYKIFKEYTSLIENKYLMDIIWNLGGKRWNYEYKYRRGGKTLCCLYIKENCLGLMIIFGKNEREKVEEIRKEISSEVLNEYDDAKIYHDGKWVMFNIQDYSKTNDIMKLLFIKRKPNKK